MAIAELAEVHKRQQVPGKGTSKTPRSILPADMFWKRPTLGFYSPSNPEMKVKWLCGFAILNSKPNAELLQIPHLPPYPVNEPRICPRSETTEALSSGYVSGV